jgi:drug/metabolite transporter (DMT)-like permease
MRLLGVLLITISAASFGAMPIFAHFAYAAGATPLTVLVFRFTIAAICFWAYVKAERMPLPKPKNLRILILLGSVGFVLQSLSFFTALTLASPTVVVLLLYLYPAIVVGLSALLRHQPSSPTKLCALGVALMGTVLTIGPLGEANRLGVILGLISALVYATYLLLSEQVMQEESALMACAVMTASAATVYASIAALHGIQLPSALSGWLAIFALVLISTVVALGTLFAGVKRLGASTAAMLSTLEPVITILLSTMLLQQPITGMQLIGGGLILTVAVGLAMEKSVSLSEGRQT